MDSVQLDIFGVLTDILVSEKCVDFKNTCCIDLHFTGVLLPFQFCHCESHLVFEKFKLQTASCSVIKWFDNSTLGPDSVSLCQTSTRRAIDH